MRIHLFLCSIGIHDWKKVIDGERFCSVCRIVEHRLDLAAGATLWVSGPAEEAQR